MELSYGQRIFLGKVQLLRPNTQGNKMKELIKSVSQIEE